MDIYSTVRIYRALGRMFDIEKNATGTYVIYVYCRLHICDVEYIDIYYRVRIYRALDRMFGIEKTHQVHM